MLSKKLLMIETLLGIDTVQFYRAVILTSSCVFGCTVHNLLFGGDIPIEERIAERIYASAKEKMGAYVRYRSPD